MGARGSYSHLSAKEKETLAIAHEQELNEVKRIFDEMDHRAIEREQKLKAAKARWEDSF